MFLEELKRRNVIRVAAAYLAGAWLLAQLVTTLGDLVTLPPWVGPVFLLTLAIGFVIALVLAWSYEYTDGGLKPESEIRANPALRRANTRHLDIAIIVLLTVALGYFIWESRFMASPGVADAMSIAVLPTRDNSAEKDQAWFASGLNEELTNALVAVPALHVIGRSTASRFDPGEEDPQEFGRTIGVTHLLESSLRAEGTSLRLQADLVAVDTGYTAWSASADGELKDILGMQRKLARDIVDRLQAHLVSADRPPADTAAPSGNFDAYTAYLRGRHHLGRRTPDDLGLAIDFLEQSLALDPRQSKVHSAVAAAYAFSQFYANDFDAGDLASRSKLHARTAIDLDESNAEAHAILGTAYLFFDRDLKGAQSALRRAYELAPGDADILNAYGDYFYYVGDFETALDMEGRAAALDPLSAVNQLELGLVLGFLGRYDDAIAQARLATQLNETLTNAWWQLFRLNYLAGDLSSARDVLQTHGDSMSTSHRAQANIRMALAEGRGEAAHEIAMELMAAFEAGEEAAATVALAFALAGDDERAAGMVQEALQTADGLLNSPMYFFLPEDWSSLPETRLALDRPELQELYEMRRQRSSGGVDDARVPAT
jgi:TolB-like protein/Tfp pilus assembly protein PilF